MYLAHEKQLRKNERVIQTCPPQMKTRMNDYLVERSRVLRPPYGGGGGGGINTLNNQTVVTMPTVCLLLLHNSPCYKTDFTRDYNKAKLSLKGKTHKN